MSQCRLRSFGLCQNFAGIGQEIRPFERKRHFPRRAMQKLRTQFLFQLGKPCTADGGRQSQFAPRSADVQTFGGHDEKA